MNADYYYNKYKAELELLSLPKEYTPNDYPWPWSIGTENKFVFSEDGLILTLKNGTLTPAGATFIFKNVASEVVSFGTKYFLQIQLEKKWYNMVAYVGWILVLIHLDPGIEKEFSIDWSNFFGNLPLGNYRFIKEFHVTIPLHGETKYAKCPFTINAK